MFTVSSSRRALAIFLLLLLLLAGCGRELSRSLAPEPQGRTSAATLGAGAPGSESKTNLAPSATILDPPLGGQFETTLSLPVTIEWTGQDPDGHLREYRYRLFGRINPDFPSVENFLSFMVLNPDVVLNHYGPEFTSWQSARVRNGSASATATYTNLQPENEYAFVVVAIDNRGDHDPDLTTSRNIAIFYVGSGTAAPQPAVARAASSAPR